MTGPVPDGEAAAVRAALARRREVAAGPAGPAGRHDPARSAGEDITVVELEVLRPGRPGLLDVVFEADGQLSHAVLCLRRPGDEVQLTSDVERPTLGLMERADGLAVVGDALVDAEAARLLLAVVGDTAPPPARSAEPVTVVGRSAAATTLAFGNCQTMTVHTTLCRGPHPGVAYLVALDDAGFNHLPAPVALWRRAGRDLGVVQECLPGAVVGWALAMPSLRDLFAFGGPAEAAGGDFAPEARALGVMTARMHLAVERAFGRHGADTGAWVEAAAEAVRHAPAGRFDPGRVAAALAASRSASLTVPAVQVHGDLHLGKVSRTDVGWVLSDCLPGGVDPVTSEPLLRSPLADVADLLWSLNRVAGDALAASGPAGAGSPAGELAADWERRNRRALVSGYLSVPGIAGLVPAERPHLHSLLSVFELWRAARLADRSPAATPPPAG